jgi:hypothetical protein
MTALATTAPTKPQAIPRFRHVFRLPCSVGFAVDGFASVAEGAGMGELPAGVGELPKENGLFSTGGAAGALSAVAPAPDVGLIGLPGADVAGFGATGCDGGSSGCCADGAASLGIRNDALQRGQRTSFPAGSDVGDARAVPQDGQERARRFMANGFLGSRRSLIQTGAYLFAH